MGLLDSIDTIIIGRKLAVDYIPYWQDVATKPDDQMYGIAQKIVGAKKIVFTNTLAKSEWSNTELAKGNLVDEIKKLKKQNGKDMVVYGGTSFVSALIKEGLIDELHLFVNPVALGKGESIFGKLEKFQNLKFIKSNAYKSGIVMMTYEPN